MDDSQRKYAVLVGGLVVGILLVVQQVKYWGHVDHVQKTLVSLASDLNQKGIEVYRENVTAELERHGMPIEPEQLEVVEDRAKDEFRVTLRYEWPMKLLFVKWNRQHVARMSSTILDL